MEKFNFILDDDDIEKYVEIAIESFCSNSGQACVATTKLLIKKSLLNNFVCLLINKLKKLKILKSLRTDYDKRSV